MEPNKQHDWSWGVTTWGILGALIAFAAVGLLMGKELTGILVIVGVLVSKLGTLIDFRYGSSKGSKDKETILNDLSKKDQV